MGKKAFARKLCVLAGCHAGYDDYIEARMPSTGIPGQVTARHVAGEVLIGNESLELCTGRSYNQLRGLSGGAFDHFEAAVLQ